MTRAPDQLAPSWLPRQQRRWIDAQLRKLFHSDVCSVCGSPFKHNSRTTGGLDAQGNVVLAGECCTDQVAAIFTQGFYSHRDYDFFQPRGTGASTNTDLTGEQIANAIASYQEVIADTDKRLDGVERRGGVARPLKVSVLNSPWKDEDRAWFEQNPKRSHRARMPLPGEADKETAMAPAGHVLIMLLRQVEPGTRLKAGFYLNAELLPVPDDEATAHALFEVAVRHEAVPPSRQALSALIRKYAVTQEPGRA